MLERRETMKHLLLSGTPREIGFQHGSEAAEEINESIRSYREFFVHEVSLEWEDAKEIAKNYIPSIEQHNSDLIEEMEGIAEGANLDFLDILVLNCRSEIALTHNRVDGCTSVGVVPPYGKYTFIAQNWDWTLAQAKSLVMLTIEQKYKPTIYMTTEAGIIGKIGANSNGVAVGLNAIRAALSSYGMPLHLALREVLNSETVEDALEFVKTTEIGSCANFVIGGKFTVYNCEISPMKVEVKKAEDVVYHSNHLCAENLISTIGKEKLAPPVDSFTRLERMKILTSSVNVPVTKDIIFEWLSNDEDTEHPINRVPKENINEFTDMVTVFSVIMNLTTGQYDLYEGQPSKPKNIYQLNIYGGIR